MIAKLNKRVRKESDEEWVKRQLGEISKNSVELSEQFSKIPLSKLFFQVIISLTIMYISSYSVTYAKLMLNLSHGHPITVQLLVSLVFTLPQTLTFYLIFKKEISILFKSINKKQLLTAFLASLLSICLAGGLQILLATLFDFTTNVHSGSNELTIKHIGFLAIQLFGEEIMFFSIFLLGISLFSKVFSNVNTQIISSSLITCIIFGLSHLSVYDGNIIQCIFLIGLPCIVKIIIYLRFKNIWTTYLEHLIFDLIVFSPAIFSNL